MAVSPILKDEVLRSLDDLPPESVVELRQFIEFLKYKAQSTALARAEPVAIAGWLEGYRFSNEMIAQARAEMWARFRDKPA